MSFEHVPTKCQKCGIKRGNQDQHISSTERDPDTDIITVSIMWWPVYLCMPCMREFDNVVGRWLREPLATTTSLPG